jgi:hypothetical protein
VEGHDVTVVPSEGTVAGQQRTGGGLYDILDLILDRGLVIDAFVRLSLVGIEILRVDARVVVASVDTYLRFAEACNRLDLENKGGAGLPDLVGKVTEDGAQSKSKTKSKGAIGGAIESFTDSLQHGRSDGDDADREPEPARRQRRAPRRKDEA